MYGIRNGGDRKSEPNSSELKKSQSDLAAQMGISVDTLQNYKILSEMIPELEELLDTGVITKYLITIQMNNLVRITYMCYAYFILLVGERKKMKELIDFIIKETPAYANEFLPDLKSLQNHIDNTQSALEKKMEKIDKKDFAKIGEYYTRIQELKDLKKKIQEAERCIERNGEKKSNRKIPNKNTISKNTVKKAKVNYNTDRTNESIAHSLSEDFVHKCPVAFSFDGERYIAKEWKDILLKLCEILYNKNSNIFRKVVLSKDMQGRSRTYFAEFDNKTIKNSMIDGRKIPGSNIYIETNHNVNDICTIIKNILKKYNIPITTMKIYLQVDCVELHNDKKSNRTLVITGNNKNSKNSDDYRFRKDTYVVQSDPVNASLSRNMGTPSHVEYLHMAEGDKKRHKSRCIEYDKRSATCRCVKSPYYTSRCGGSSHCQYYKEKSSIM